MQSGCLPSGHESKQNVRGSCCGKEEEKESSGWVSAAFLGNPEHYVAVVIGWENGSQSYQV